MKRHHQILAAILVVQVILSVVVFWPRSAATAEPEPLFPDLSADDVVALTVVDAVGETVTLQKADGEWVLPEADDYPVLGERVTSLLEKIAGLTTGRLVTRTEASHRRLQVASDEFQRRIDIELTDGTRHTLYLGSSPRYGVTHFRAAAQNETYLSDTLSSMDAGATASAWVDTTYLSVPQEEVTTVTLENRQGTFVFSQDEEGNWTLDGLDPDQTPDQAAISAVVRKATTVTMVAPLGTEAAPEYGLDDPNAVVTIETADGAITVEVGAPGEDENTYVAHSSESSYYVLASQTAVGSLVDSAREDFVTEPPTPTPEGNGE
ncbi:MAG: DUF4340 domain-containing protein [Anaerolineae bacterium]|jgi:YD repeat-containing protein